MNDIDKGLKLPTRPFFFTIDQIATLLEVNESYVKSKMLHFENRSPGYPPRSKMKAINIAPEGEKPEWRVSEMSFMRYLRNKGIRFYERGYMS